MTRQRMDRQHRVSLAGRLSAAIGVAVLATGAVPSAAGAHPVRQYRAIDLGIPGMVQAMNDRGDAVGVGEFTLNLRRPFLWRDGRLTDLGQLTPAAEGRGEATDINNAGQVVGRSSIGSKEPPIDDQAFIWRDGVMTALGVPGRDSRADGINDRGQVVGTSDPGTDPHAFLWQRGSVTDLGPGFAWDIDNRGRVAGARLDGQGHTIPCVWYGGRVSDLSLGSSAQGQARAINNRGWTVGTGWREVEGGLDQRGYLWRSGPAIDLGHLGVGETVPADVNDRGQIVGMTGLNNVDDPIPFLWHGGKMTNLAEHGVTAGYLTAVNNRGELGGSIRYPDGESLAAVYR